MYGPPVTRLPLFLLRFLILMAVVCPQRASASMGVQLETRVRGIELVVHALVGGSSARSPEKHLGSSPAYDGIAPGYSLAAEGFSTAARAGQLADAIPAAQAGRITMGVGLAEDATGARSVLVGTSEPGGYLRPGVTLAPGETMAAGAGHAEADIVNYAQQNGLRLLEVGATRPICPTCAALIDQAGAVPVTPLKVVP